jgi:hypothetical protein
VINNRYLHRWFDEAEKFAIDNNLGIHEWVFLADSCMRCLQLVFFF